MTHGTARHNKKEQTTQRSPLCPRYLRDWRRSQAAALVAPSVDATRQAGVALQSFTAQSVLLPERFRVDCAFGGDRTVALSQLPGALYACCDDIRKPRPQTHIKPTTPPRQAPLPHLQAEISWGSAEEIGKGNKTQGLRHAAAQPWQDDSRGGEHLPTPPKPTLAGTANWSAK